MCYNSKIKFLKLSKYGHCMKVPGNLMKKWYITPMLTCSKIRNSNQVHLWKRVPNSKIFLVKWNCLLCNLENETFELKQGMQVYKHVQNLVHVLTSLRVKNKELFA